MAQEKKGKMEVMVRLTDPKAIDFLEKRVAKHHSSNGAVLKEGLDLLMQNEQAVAHA